VIAASPLLVRSHRVHYALIVDSIVGDSRLTIKVGRLDAHGPVGMPPWHRASATTPSGERRISARMAGVVRAQA
jgi:hypothetical protein